MMSPGLRSAIPDGDDLLLAVQATSKSTGRELTGVCRFRWDRSKWVPAFFTPVTSAGEPSVARHADGSLFFTARTRGGRRNNASGKVIDPWAATCGNSHPFFTEGESCEAIELWTATDADGPWTQNISLANQRSEAPLSVNATTDGIIFVLANPAGITSADGKVNWHQIKRARLALWQVAEDKRSFMPSRPRLIRDATEEFESVEKTAWLLDHPTSAVVRLADGRWHCLVTYRVSTLSYPAPEEAETFPLVMTAHHGCYVEEVITGQPAAPIWRFG